ncbi:hypothetical protein KMC72_gp58 [Paenibacillus phage Dragolir]|uniref:Uncharacterized protein n=1 Tax=Paenibacillus phage Dragolir TaxID=2070190 RepID=A0A2I7SC45_9CAUD|nr:hypothetical protein KMC72_gp58 [Paenibacillus phage Dragolir]AUS03471.1 hypothetical protein DRAGOLIR_58 [Paenibacillus phage Dragolir]
MLRQSLIYGRRKLQASWLPQFREKLRGMTPIIYIYRASR